jgi:hypothetical protein
MEFKVGDIVVIDKDCVLSLSLLYKQSDRYLNGCISDLIEDGSRKYCKVVWENGHKDLYRSEDLVLNLSEKRDKQLNKILYGI